MRILFDEANRKNDGVVEFDLTVVGSAAEAMTLLRAPDTERFDLILLDMLLPDTTGDELLPDLRSMVGEDVTIVMASAHSHTSLVQLCVRRGADAFLVKPLGSEEVRHIWQFVKELPDGSFKTHVEEIKTSFNTSHASRASSSGMLEPALDPTSASFTTRASVLATAAARSHAHTSDGPTGSDSPLDVIICAGYAPTDTPSSSRSMPCLVPSSATALASANACGEHARDEQALQQEMSGELAAIDLCELPSSEMPAIIDRIAQDVHRPGLDSLALEASHARGLGRTRTWLQAEGVTAAAALADLHQPPEPSTSASNPASNPPTRTRRTSRESTQSDSPGAFAQPRGVPRRTTDESTTSCSTDTEGAVAADCKKM